MDSERHNEFMAHASAAGSRSSGASASEQRSMAVLVVTAVDAEREAVLRGIAGGVRETDGGGNNVGRATENDARGNRGSSEATDRQSTGIEADGKSVGPLRTDLAFAADEGSNVRFDVIAAGVGPAYAAASTATALARGRYDLVISAGIGGGFPSVVEIGTLVVANAIVAADLGAETADGQLTLDELGFGTSRAPVDAAWSGRIAAALTSAGLQAACGPILTVSLATGRAETAELRRVLVPGAAAEGMEGYGVAIAADASGTPFAELRAISNAVGPRDRSAWRIGDALRALENAFCVIADLCIERARPTTGELA